MSDNETNVSAPALNVADVADPNINVMADIVTAFVSNNHTTPDAVLKLMNDVYSTITTMQNGGGVAAHPHEHPVSAFAAATAAPAAAPVSPEPAPAPKEPAVPIRKSVTPEHLVCLDCGKHFKSLKRHLASVHNQSPDEYRANWGLKPDYPMVAPNYAKARSELAVQLGLGKKAPGRKGRGGRAAPEAAPAPAPEAAPAPAAAE